MIDDDEGLCSSMVDLMRSIGHGAEPFGVVQFVPFQLYRRRCSSARNEWAPPHTEAPRAERHDVRNSDDALPERDLHDEAILAGAQRLLRKPFESKSPLDCIERSLSDERPSR